MSNVNSSVMPTGPYTLMNIPHPTETGCTTCKSFKTYCKMCDYADAMGGYPTRLYASKFSFAKK